jgi:DNA invertase Pin-like site-specific DNA recombinase
MLATFAAFETDVRRERQAEGIARVKADPKLRWQKYAGRARSVDRNAIRQAIEAGRKPAEIAREFGVSRMSVWRASQE